MKYDKFNFERFFNNLIDCMIPALALYVLLTKAHVIHFNSMWQFIR